MANEINKKELDAYIEQENPAYNEAEQELVYICPIDCRFNLGEDGCRIENLPEARYEETGDYPLCPFYMKPLLDT